MRTDLYAVLGVSPTASAEQIRKAYKTQLLRCHPDKNGNSTSARVAFNNLAAAYTILSSRSSRAEYDCTRSPAPSAEAYTPKSANDPFADFAFRKQFAEACAQSVSAEEGRPVDSEHLFESLFGRERAQYSAGHSETTFAAAAAAETDARRAAEAEQCDRDTADSVPGSSASGDDASSSSVEDDFTDHRASDDDSDTAHTMVSVAEEQVPVASVNNLVAADSTSDSTRAHNAPSSTASALSDGRMPKAPDHEVDLSLTLEELFCGCVKKRRLRKQVMVRPAAAALSAPPVFTETSEILTITIRPGYRPGDKIRFREASDQAPGVVPADVVFVISQIPHKRFTLVGNCDVKVQVCIGIADALAGATVNLETLSGHLLQIRTTEVITPGLVKVLPGKGMPLPASIRAKPSDELEFGNLLISFEIQFPKLLTADEKQKVRVLFQSLEDRSRGNNLSNSPGSSSSTASPPTNGQHAPIRRTTSMFSGTSPSSRNRSALSGFASKNTVGSPPVSPRSTSRLTSVRSSGSLASQTSDVKDVLSSLAKVSATPRSRENAVDAGTSASDTRSSVQRKRGFFFFNPSG
jgi:DnaJ-class molecular chaperone